MATAMIYDTLKLAEQLEHEAGFDAARARAMARILAENAGGNLATREDVLVARAELETATRGVEGKLGGAMGALEEKLSGTIRDVEERLGGAIRDVEVRLGGTIRHVERRVGGLEGKLAGLDGKVRVLHWVTGTTLAGVAALLGIAITVALHAMHLD